MCLVKYPFPCTLRSRSALFQVSGQLEGMLPFYSPTTWDGNDLVDLRNLNDFKQLKNLNGRPPSPPPGYRYDSGTEVHRIYPWTSRTTEPHTTPYGNRAGKNDGRAAGSRHTSRGGKASRASGGKGSGEGQIGKGDQEVRPSSNSQTDATAADTETGAAWPNKNGHGSKKDVVFEVDLPRVAHVVQGNYADDETPVVAVIADADGRVRLFLTAAEAEHREIDVGVDATGRAVDDQPTNTAENRSTTVTPSHVPAAGNELAEYIEPETDTYCRNYVHSSSAEQPVPRAEFVNGRQNANDMVTRTSLSTTSVSAYEYADHDIFLFLL